MLGCARRWRPRFLLLEPKNGRSPTSNQKGVWFEQQDAIINSGGVEPSCPTANLGVSGFRSIDESCDREGHHFEHSEEVINPHSFQLSTLREA